MRRTRYPLSPLDRELTSTVQTTVCHVPLRRSPDGYRRTVRVSKLRSAARIIVAKQDCNKCNAVIQSLMTSGRTLLMRTIPRGF